MKQAVMRRCGLGMVLLAMAAGTACAGGVTGYNKAQAAR